MGGMHQTAARAGAGGPELGVDVPLRCTRCAQLEKAGDAITAVVLQGRSRSSPADMVLVNADLPYAYDAAARRALSEHREEAFLLLRGADVPRAQPRISRHLCTTISWSATTCARPAAASSRRTQMPDDSAVSTLSPPRAPTRRQAPAGCENLFVLVLAPSQHADPAQRMDWAVEGPKVEAGCSTGWSKWACRAAGSHRHQAAGHAGRLHRPTYGNLRGEAFGLRTTCCRSARSGRRTGTRSYQNLFFVGQSTHPGCGLPMALISAECVVERITAAVAV